MTREDVNKVIQSNQKIDDSSRAWVELLIDKIYDEFDAKHKYIIELIAHTAGSGNKAISQTLLTIDGILKEMREQK